MPKDSRPVPELTPDLARLAGRLLQFASTEFSNHGCNDFDLRTIPGFDAREARAALDLATHTWNGDPEEHDPENDYRYAADFSLMRFLAAELEKAAGTPRPRGSTEQSALMLHDAVDKANDAEHSAARAVLEYKAAKDRAQAKIAQLRKDLATLEDHLKA